MASNLNFFLKTLTPQEITNFKEFNKDLKIVNEGEMMKAQELNIENYVADLLGALRSGLKWSSLTPGEQELIKVNSHESHWKDFLKF